MSVDLGSPVADLVGGGRGRLLEAVVRLGRPFSIRQLAKMSGVSHPQTSELLKQFEELGLVRSQRVGRAITYEPVERNVLLQAIRRILFLQQEIIDDLREQAQSAPSGVTVALFGSMASGRAVRGSDVDVLVIADDHIEEKPWLDDFVGHAQDASGLPVNPLRFSRSAWEHFKAKEEPFTKTIRENHLILAGEI